MTIFRVSAEHDKYDACYIDYDAGRNGVPFDEKPFFFDGTAQLAGWIPFKINRYNELPLGDYVSKLSGDIIIMEKKAIDVLLPFLGNAEILPLLCDFGNYWAINVITVLDAIDYENSVFKNFPSGSRNGHPRVMFFRKYEFIPEEIAEYHMFKIADMPKSAIFVDDVFVKTVEENGITGFKFDLVWESK